MAWLLSDRLAAVLDVVGSLKERFVEREEDDLPARYLEDEKLAAWLWEGRLANMLEDYLY